MDKHFDFFATVRVGVIGFHTSMAEGVKDGLVFAVEPDENHGVADSTRWAVLVEHDIAFLDFALFVKLGDSFVRVGDLEDVFALFDVFLGGTGHATVIPNVGVFRDDTEPL